jgi:predicted LPLAT superfamily acyltransferase
MTAAWARRQEGGGAGALRVLLWLLLRVGQPIAPVLLWPAALWFFLAAPAARAASRDYLRRVLPRPTWRVGLRHFHCFAAVTLDRVFLLTGRTADFRIEDVGLERLEAALAQGRGCLLLGAHLGSFEALRGLAQRSPVPVRTLMYKRNDGALTRLFDQLAPDVASAIIEIGTPSSMLLVRETVAAGGVVGILADRAPGDQKLVEVGFLGGRARLPAGPMIVASMVGAPVLLCWAVRTGVRAYRISIEPFADQVSLARATRQADLRDWVARYAARLEVACRAAPLNWFNFYDFWESGGDAAALALGAGTDRDGAAAAGLGGERLSAGGAVGAS